MSPADASLAARATAVIAGRPRQVCSTVSVQQVFVDAHPLNIDEHRRVSESFMFKDRQLEVEHGTRCPRSACFAK